MFKLLLFIISVDEEKVGKVPNAYGTCNFSTSGNFYYKDRAYNSSYIPFTPCANDPLEDKTLSICLTFSFFKYILLAAAHYTG